MTALSLQMNKNSPEELHAQEVGALLMLVSGTVATGLSLGLLVLKIKTSLHVTTCGIGDVREADKGQLQASCYS